MNDDRLEELATLYALDLLEGQEKLRFEQELARNAELRRFVDDLKETSAHLADAAPAQPLPAGLKDRILRDAKPRAQVIQFPRNVWVPWSIAAAVALMAALVGQTFIKAKRENEHLRTEAARLNAAQTEAWARVKQLETEAVALHRSLLEAEKFRDLASATDAERARLQNEILALRERDLLSQLKIAVLQATGPGVADGTVAVALYDIDRKRGVVNADKLPPLGPDKDYQLWVVDAAYTAPVSAGLLQPDAEGKLKISFDTTKLVSKPQAFAISVEPKGGSESARGPIILLGK